MFAAGDSYNEPASLRIIINRRRAELKRHLSDEQNFLKYGRDRTGEVL
jgi:hypothetical protein